MSFHADTFFMYKFFNIDILTKNGLAQNMIYGLMQ